MHYTVGIGRRGELVAGDQRRGRHLRADKIRDAFNGISFLSRARALRQMRCRPVDADLQQHYANLINFMLEGRVVPFLGAGANLCGRPHEAVWHERRASGSCRAAASCRPICRTSFILPADADLARVSQDVSLIDRHGRLFGTLHDLFDHDYRANDAASAVCRVAVGAAREEHARRATSSSSARTTTTCSSGRSRTAGEPFDLVTYISDGDTRGKFVHTDAGRDDAHHRHSESVRRPVARAADDHPEDPRRGESRGRRRRGRQLRHHRGSLHRLPDAHRPGESHPGDAHGEAAEEPLPVPRLRPARLESARDPPSHRRRAAAQLQVVGDPAQLRPTSISEFWGRRDVDILDIDLDALHRAPCAARLRLMPPRPRLPRVRECPYTGLMPFTEEQAEFFFGREAEREIIAANLMASRLTLLYGPSGVGKSSVLNAGVVHDLRARGGRQPAATRHRPISRSSSSAPGATTRSPASSRHRTGDRPARRRARRSPTACAQLDRGDRRRSADHPRSVRGVLPLSRLDRRRRARSPSSSRARSTASTCASASSSRCARTRSRSSTSSRGASRICSTTTCASITSSARQARDAIVKPVERFNQTLAPGDSADHDRAGARRGGAHAGHDRARRHLGGTGKGR